MNGRKWTENEDRIILNAVKKSNNYPVTFNNLSKQLDRTYKAVSSRWYNTLCKNCEYSIALMSTSEKPHNTGIKRMWNSILNFFK